MRCNPFRWLLGLMPILLLAGVAILGERERIEGDLTARSQLAAMATGAKLVQVPQPVLQETYINYQPQTRRPYGLMEWPALLRKLDRTDPTYKE